MKLLSAPTLIPLVTVICVVLLYVVNAESREGNEVHNQQESAHSVLFRKMSDKHAEVGQEFRAKLASNAASIEVIKTDIDHIASQVDDHVDDYKDFKADNKESHDRLEEQVDKIDDKLGLILLEIRSNRSTEPQ